MSAVRTGSAMQSIVNCLLTGQLEREYSVHKPNSKGHGSRREPQELNPWNLRNSTLRTVRAYLYCGCDVEQTAAHLGVHVVTVYQHLRTAQSYMRLGSRQAAMECFAEWEATR